MHPIPSRGPSALLCALGTALMLGACGGDDDNGTTLGTATVEEDLPETRVQGAGPVVGVLPDVLPPLALDVTETDEYERGDFASVVTRISIEGLTLAVASPESENNETDSFGAEDGMPDDLSFLNGLDLYIVATIDGERQIERLGGLPENDPALDPDRAARTLELDMTGVNILDFVEAPEGYVVRMEVGGELPPDDVVFGGTIEYEIGFGVR